MADRCPLMEGTVRRWGGTEFDRSVQVRRQCRRLAVMWVTMTISKSARQEALTLVQFDAAVDAHAGSPQLFAATMRGLRMVRAEAAALASRRAEVFDVLKDYYARGITTDRGTHLVLKQTTPKPGRVHRAVPSAVLKKACPTLWEQAKVRVPYVQAKSAEPTAVVSSVRVPRGCRLATVIEVYQGFAEPAAALRASEASMVARLKKIGADNGWDGLPIEFSDGWLVGLERMQYSSDRLAEIAPETFAALAVDVQRASSPQVFIHDALATECEDEAELGIGL